MPFASATRVRFLLSAVIILKNSTLVVCEKSVSSFTLPVPNTTGFLRVFRFPPAQTLDL